jgi:hypothetical protein
MYPSGMDKMLSALLAASARHGPAQAPSVAGVADGPLLDGGRALMGRASSGTRRGATGRAVQRGGKAFWGGRRVDGGGAGAGESSGGAGEGSEAPQETPGYFKYGAKILTEGQAPKYEAAATREHAFQAGEIVLNPRRANHVGRAPGVQQGPRDTPPPCTPGSIGCSGGSAGGNSITANAPSSGGGSGGGNGGGNGNGGDSHDNDNGDGRGNGDGQGGGRGSDNPTGFDGTF